MEKVLAKLYAMGAFGHSVCELCFDSETKKIYCSCVNGTWECDMSQLGWGSYAFCPLVNFNYDLKKEKDRKELVSTLEYFKKYKVLPFNVINQLLILLEGAQPA